MMINQAGNLNKEDKRIFNNNGRFFICHFEEHIAEKDYAI